MLLALLKKTWSDYKSILVASFSIILIKDDLKSDYFEQQINVPKGYNVFT